MKTPLTAATDLILEHEQKTPGLSRQQAIQCAISTASRLVQNSQGIPVVHEYWMEIENLLCKIQAGAFPSFTPRKPLFPTGGVMRTEKTNWKPLVSITVEKAISPELAFMRQTGVIPEDCRDLTITVLDGTNKTYKLSQLLRKYKQVAIMSIALDRVPDLSVFRK